MRELLADNISLTQQLESLGGHQLPSALGALKPRLRELSTLPTWLYCFLAYAALRCTDPWTQDKLAYARIIIRESQRHGGSSWLDYDRVFHQQAALDQYIPWNCLHPSIQAATIIGRSVGAGVFCTFCREPDHREDACALAYLHPQRQQPPHLDNPPAANRTPPRSKGDPPGDICHSWNRGSCIYPTTFRYRHICSLCFQRHMVRDCPKAKAEFQFGRNARSKASCGSG